MNAQQFMLECGLDRGAITAAPSIARPAFVAHVLQILAMVIQSKQVTEFSGFTWDGGPMFEGTIKGNNGVEYVSFDLSAPPEEIRR